ncbi:MAG: NUDIX hydrolase [archaeon]
MNYRKGACAMIFKGRALLLVRKQHYPANQYALPGGGSEPGEKMLDTFYREMREELGLMKSDFTDVHQASKNLTYVWEEKFVKELGYDGQDKAIFVARMNDTKITLNEENEAYIFLTPEELDSIIMFENEKRLFNELRSLGELPPSPAPP